MPERKYIQQWRDVPSNPYCPAGAMIEEVLTENAGGPGPNAAISDSLRSQAAMHLEEHPCHYVKDGQCELARFLTKQALKVRL
jgi:hypothetical protein